MSKKRKKFYTEALEILGETKAPFLLGGAFALYYYTGIYRDTKDVDIFCKADDYPSILKIFRKKGYDIEITDDRWLAKVKDNGYLMDLIFDSFNNLTKIDDLWFKYAPTDQVLGTTVKYVPAEELIWSKIYIHSRERYDGADINHIILRYGEKLDWDRLTKRMNNHWQLYLSHLLNFQFVYPSKRDKVPREVMESLLKKAHEQYELPASLEKVCRGPLIDQKAYETDIIEWKYKVVTIKSI